MSTSPNTAHSDAGFTLVETIIVVLLVALVSSVVGAAITMFVRTDGSVTSRLTNSRDLQNLTNYLPADVASTRLIQSNVPPYSFPPPPNPPPATCGSGGDVVLHLEWSESWTPSYSNTVTYRVVPNITNPDQLIRYECENAGSPTSLVVGQSFDSMSIELQRDTIDPTKLTGTVDLRLNYPDGEFKRVTATSRHFLPTP